MVGEIAPALDVLDNFITIAKELSKLPAMVLPQYRDAVRDMYEICQKLLVSNENLVRWLYKFLYFDFRQQDARTKFLELVRDYKTMKQGPDFRQLKFRCGDIGSIYYQHISSKLGGWFSNQSKLEEVQGIFNQLTNADNDMVAFTYDYVVKKIDHAVDRMENHVESDQMNLAEDVRLKTKTKMKNITERLERFSGELSDLVLIFANKAHVAVTLGA